MENIDGSRCGMSETEFPGDCLNKGVPAAVLAAHKKALSRYYSACPSCGVERVKWQEDEQGVKHLV